MNSFFTKEQHWLDKWDAFLQQSERGLYNQLSDWIKSYEVYGFDYQFFIFTKNDEIIGGCGIVIAKLSFFKFYIIPSGPVLLNGYEDQIDFIINELQTDAKKKGSCYFQISLPVLKNKESVYNYPLPNISSTSDYFLGKVGAKFKYVIPLHGYRLTPLKGNTYESVLQSFSKNCKRNITKSKTENLVFRFVTSENEVREGYQCFVLNAKEKGYPLRSYESMKETLSNYIKKDYAKMGCCYLNDILVGAIYVMKTGKRLTYINGGVLKEHQHMNISHFMHNYLIEYSINQGYDSYDISVGGSVGVKKFKESFGTTLYEFIETRHWILKPFRFYLFSLVDQHLKNHKAKVASLLVKFKKNKKITSL